MVQTQRNFNVQSVKSPPEKEVAKASPHTHFWATRGTAEWPSNATASPDQLAHIYIYTYIHTIYPGFTVSCPVGETQWLHGYHLSVHIFGRPGGQDKHENGGPGWPWIQMEKLIFQVNSQQCGYSKQENHTQIAHTLEWDGFRNRLRSLCDLLGWLNTARVFWP